MTSLSPVIADTGLMWPALRLALATAVIVLLLLGLRRALPRFAPASLAQWRERPFVEVLGRQHVAPRNALVMVQVEGRRLLLSENPDGYRLITEMEGPGPADANSSLRVHATRSGETQ